MLFLSLFSLDVSSMSLLCFSSFDLFDLLQLLLDSLLNSLDLFILSLQLLLDLGLLDRLLSQTIEKIGT